MEDLLDSLRRLVFWGLGIGMVVLFIYGVVAKGESIYVWVAGGLCLLGMTLLTTERSV